MSHNSEPGAIASHVSTAIESFRGLERALRGSSDSSDLSDLNAPNRFLLTVENEFTRFKMWAGNQAAHQSGPASLDHRLREAPLLQQQVLYLLKDLSESLEDAVSLVSQGISESHRIQSDSDYQYGEASLGSLNHDNEDDFSDSDGDGSQPGDGLSTIFEDIREAIDCLLRLSVAIANPAPHERFRKLGAGPSEDVSFYEPHDIAYVRDKFPKITDGLAETLGKFITRRRQFFKYREAHHAKMSAGLDSMASNREADTSRTEVIPKTVASSLPEYLKNITDFDPRANFIDEDVRSDTGMSRTSYATSPSFLAEDTNEQAQRPTPPLRVPPLPASAETGIFECPFCYRMISARTRTAWKRHVFGDLRPYTCIISHCAESNTDFDRRHIWISHVSKYHWRSWSCPFKCDETASSALELTQHVKTQHIPNVTEKEVEAIVALGERAAPSDTSNQCVICGHTLTGLEKYIKHVGRHLEQLVLWALPGLEDENVPDENASDKENNAASDLDANSSRSSSEALIPTLQLLKQASQIELDQLQHLQSQQDTVTNTQQTKVEITQLHESYKHDDFDRHISCLCNRVKFGPMINCSNSDCKNEWFHLECVGIDETPGPTTKWYCPECWLMLDMGERDEVPRRVEDNSRAQYEESRKKARQPSIRFKDAAGRDFAFPFHAVATWAGMESLIKQTFMHVDVLGPHAIEGHYDLNAPNGEIIHPSVWENVIQPDLVITMTMWPVDKAVVEKLKELEVELRAKAVAEAGARMEVLRKAAEKAQDLTKADLEKHLRYLNEYVDAVHIEASKERKRAEELAQVRFEAAMKAQKEASKAEANKAQEEAECLTPAERERGAKINQEARLKYETSKRGDGEVRMETDGIPRSL